MPARTFIDSIRETLADEMRRDETVIVLGEDVGKKGGVFLATDGLWAEFGDDRVIDTPLTESMIVGASIGAAVNGLRPVAEIGNDQHGPLVADPRQHLADGAAIFGHMEVTWCPACAFLRGLFGHLSILGNKLFLRLK